MNANLPPESLVTKRNGQPAEFDIEKIHRMLFFATDGIAGVSVSQIEHQINGHYQPGMRTVDIHESLIKSASDLITADHPNYQLVASHLVNFKIRKEVYGNYVPDRLFDIVERNVRAGVYHPGLLTKFAPEDYDEMDTFIDHDRDLALTYSGIEQFRQKYLVKDYSTKTLFETPQVAYMLIAASLYHKLEDIKQVYDLLSQHHISLPTPIIAGVRTPMKQFSSCVLIECDDSIDSINATASAITKYISQRAGIGIGAGAIRGEGSAIRGGQARHTGIIPFLKYFQAAVKSCHQGGLRGGAGTAHYPIWHWEFEDLVVLKNNKGTEEARVRHLDHCFQLSRLFYVRLKEQGEITFFSPSDVPGLYNAFYKGDQTTFEELYVKYENDITIRKKTLPAVDVFMKLMNERKDTGRIYIQNVDNVNAQGSFLDSEAPIRQSNLCQEIDLPTTPLINTVNDQKGKIALCTLGAINWGMINDPKDFKEPCSRLVTLLDDILTYQEYPLIAAQNHTLDYRPLGIGINNLAFWLAKRNMAYANYYETWPEKFLDDIYVLDEYAEAWSYYLIKQSIGLAKLKGPCRRLQDTKYGQGLFPIDTYNKNVDDFVQREPSYDWERLRKELKLYGIRNSTLMACMPAESSSLVSNSTNGVEPPRELVSYKQSKEGIIPQVVPQIHHLKNKYDLLWEQKDPTGYLIIMAVLQKWIDQGISVNTSYNPAHFADQKVPMSKLINDVVFFYKYGGKQLYYNNTNDLASDESEDLDDGCGDVCVI